MFSTFLYFLGSFSWKAVWTNCKPSNMLSFCWIQETQKVWLENMAATPCTRCWVTSALLVSWGFTLCSVIITRPSKSWRTSSSTRRYDLNQDHRCFHFHESITVVLVLQDPDPAWFRCFSASAHQISTNEWLTGLCRAEDSLKSRKTTKTGSGPSRTRMEGHSSVRIHNVVLVHFILYG